MLSRRALLASGLAGLTAACSDRRAGNVAFDAAAWRTQDERHPVRHHMVDDLVKRRLLDGLTREDVVALLGPPTVTDKWRDYDMVYWCGPDRTSMPIDSTWLLIRLSGGRVASYGSAED